MREVCKASFHLIKSAKELFDLMSDYAEVKELRSKHRNRIVDEINKVQAQVDEVRRQVHMIPGG